MPRTVRPFSGAAPGNANMMDLNGRFEGRNQSVPHPGGSATQKGEQMNEHAYTDTTDKRQRKGKIEKKATSNKRLALLL